MNLANKISNTVEGKYRDIFTPNSRFIMTPNKIGNTIVYEDNSDTWAKFKNRLIGQDISRAVNTLIVIGGNSLEIPKLEAISISKEFDDYGIILYGAFGKSLLSKFGLKAIYVDDVKNAAILTRKLYYLRVIVTPLHASKEFETEARDFINILKYY